MYSSECTIWTRNRYSGTCLVSIITEMLCVLVLKLAVDQQGGYG